MLIELRIEYYKLAVLWLLKRSPRSIFELYAAIRAGEQHIVRAVREAQRDGFIAWEADYPTPSTLKKATLCLTEACASEVFHKPANVKVVDIQNPL